MHDLVTRAASAFSALPVDDGTRMQAVARLDAWTSDPRHADDLPQLAGLAQRGRWDALLDAFAGELGFGTGGCRGRVGLGPNRVNPYTVSHLVAAHARWLLATVPEARRRGVVLGFDTRRFHDLAGVYDPVRPNPVLGLSSRDIVDLAASVYGGFGIAVHVPPPGRWLSVGLLSFAIREVGAAAGLYVSASHNPPDDNGAKLYDDRGCQLVPPVDAEVAAQVGPELPGGDPIRHELNGDLWDAWTDMLVEAVGPLSRPLHVVYTALHGVGASLVPPALEAAGARVSVVGEQQASDGRFGTVRSPNPESPEALVRAVELARRVGADLVLGTDPDADRVGVAVPDGDAWRVLMGQEIAALCVDRAVRSAPPGALVLRTAVTTSVVSAIARDCGLPVQDDLLVGFKYLGDVLARREDAGEPTSLAVAVEESHGVLVSERMRDKDAVGGALLVAAAAAEHDLVGRLAALDRRYGPIRHRLATAALLGATGRAGVARAMASLRRDPPVELGGARIVAWTDHLEGEPPQSLTEAASRNVLVYDVDAGRVTIRPSGTEPKVKVYVEARGEPGMDGHAVAARADHLAEAALAEVLVRAR